MRILLLTFPVVILKSILLSCLLPFITPSSSFLPPSRGRCPAPSPACSSIRGQSEWRLCWWREQVCRKETTLLWSTHQVRDGARCCLQNIWSDWWSWIDHSHLSPSPPVCVCVSCRYRPDCSFLRQPVRRLCSHHGAAASPSEHLHHLAHRQDDRGGQRFYFWNAPFCFVFSVNVAAANHTTVALLETTLVVGTICVLFYV